MSLLSLFTSRSLYITYFGNTFCLVECHLQKISYKHKIILHQTKIKRYWIWNYIHILFHILNLDMRGNWSHLNIIMKIYISVFMNKLQLYCQNSQSFDLFHNFEWGRVGRPKPNDWKKIGHITKPNFAPEINY